MDAHANSQLHILKPRIARAHCLKHAKSCTNSPLRIIFMSLGIAKIHQ
jgi:hypothetical protein